MISKELSKDFVFSNNHEKDMRLLQILNQNGVHSVEIGLYPPVPPTKDENGNEKTIEQQQAECRTACNEYLSRVSGMFQAIMSIEGMRINSFHLPYSGLLRNTYSSNENERNFAVNQLITFVNTVNSVAKEQGYQPPEGTQNYYFVIHPGAFVDLPRLPKEEEKPFLTPEQNHLLEVRSERILNAQTSIATVINQTASQLAIENLNGANPCCTPNELTDFIHAVNAQLQNGVPHAGSNIDSCHCSSEYPPEAFAEKSYEEGINVIGTHISAKNSELENYIQFTFVNNKGEKESFFVNVATCSPEQQWAILSCASKDEIMASQRNMDQHLPIGQGNTNFVPFFACLARHDYKGTYNHEVSGKAMQKDNEESFAQNVSLIVENTNNVIQQAESYNANLSNTNTTTDSANQIEGATTESDASQGENMSYSPDVARDMPAIIATEDYKESEHEDPSLTEEAVQTLSPAINETTDDDE